MATFNISLNKELANLVDERVKEEKYANRSEFFRQLLRNAYFLESNDDWFEKELYLSELKKRIKELKQPNLELTTSAQFDKEFNL